MATTRKAPARRKRVSYWYVPLGAGQLLVEKARALSGDWRSVAREGLGLLSRTVDSLAERGERLAGSIKRSAPTRRAVDRTRVARSRVKAAATSLRRAAWATAEATRDAAGKAR